MTNVMSISDTAFASNHNFTVQNAIYLTTGTPMISLNLSYGYGVPTYRCYLYFTTLNATPAVAPVTFDQIRSCNNSTICGWTRISPMSTNFNLTLNNYTWAAGNSGYLYAACYNELPVSSFRSNVILLWTFNSTNNGSSINVPVIPGPGQTPTGTTPTGTTPTGTTPTGTTPTGTTPTGTTPTGTTPSGTTLPNCTATVTTNCTPATTTPGTTPSTGGSTVAGEWNCTAQNPKCNCANFTLPTGFTKCIGFGSFITLAKMIVAFFVIAMTL